MKKRILCLLICLTMLAGFLPVTAQADTVINSVSLTLDFPEAGKEPPRTATSNGTGYSLYSIDWYDYYGGFYLEGTDKIQAGHTYEVTLWVEAQSGYDFNSINDYTPNITAYVNGEQVEAVKAYEYKAWAMVELRYYFNMVPEKGWVRSVNLTAPVPVAGQKPSYNKFAGTEYHSGNVYFSGATDENMINGVAWYEKGGDELDPNTAVFEANKVYTLHCLLFPEEGYRFDPNATVYVNGQAARARYDYDTFLAVFFDFPPTAVAESEHTHTPSDWRTTGAYHYKACTTCGDFLEQEDHYGGTATCKDPGVCAVCGYAYLESNEDHTPDTSKWVARGTMYHFHKCKLCGAHCDIEDHRWSPKYHPVDEKGHAWICADCKVYSEVEAHKPGPAATDTEPQTCTECGYILAPATNHTHSLTKVEEVAPTCGEPGVAAHYTCSGCSQLFTDEAGKETTTRDGLTIPPQGHKLSNEHGYDEQFHWYLCVTCREPMLETTQPHELKEDVCEICGYDSAKPLPAEPEPTDPEDTEPEGTFGSGKTDRDREKDRDKDEEIPWWFVLVAALFALVVVAVIVIAVVKTVKKKKS